MIPFELVCGNSILLQNRPCGLFIFIVATSFYNARKFIKIQSEHYFEKLGLFNENSDEYARVLGCHFNGIESDWGEILRITDICTSIQEQFNGHVPEKTATALSHDHQEFNASLSSFRSNAASALTNAKRITAENRFNADLESQDIQTIEILSTSENTLNWLNHISKQKSDRAL